MVAICHQVPSPRCCPVPPCATRSASHDSPIMASDLSLGPGAAPFVWKIARMLIRLTSVDGLPTIWAGSVPASSLALSYSSRYASCCQLPGWISQLEHSPKSAAFHISFEYLSTSSLQVPPLSDRRSNLIICPATAAADVDVDADAAAQSRWLWRNKASPLW